MRETRAVRPAFPIHYLDQGGSVNENLTPKLCECGCGEPITAIYGPSHPLHGQPKRWIKGHSLRGQRITFDPPNPSGLCQCGCGSKTTIAPRTITSQGDLRGHPRRFIKGHHIRLTQTLPWSSELWHEEDRGHDTPCWIWQKTLDRNGYAIYGSNQRVQKSQFAHRESYTRYVAPIDSGLTIDHLCRQHACVNPTHLEPVPHETNVRRGDSAKLTLEDAEEIRRLKSAGVYYKDIAARFGVHHSTVYYVCSRKGWR